MPEKSEQIMFCGTEGLRLFQDAGHCVIKTCAKVDSIFRLMLLFVLIVIN